MKNHNNGFWNILAKKVFPIGAMGLVGLGIISHSISNLGSGLSSKYKFWLDIVGIGVQVIILFTLIFWCSYIMYFHNN